MMEVDTISALSSGSGRAAISLIRLSGPKALEIGQSLCRTSVPFSPRQAQLFSLFDEKGPVDEVLVTYFKAPHSFTGEDVVEIACHGNPRIVEQILALCVSRGTREAEAGEFTRRALANGKLSLEEVESLDWILNSSSMEGVRWGLQSKMQNYGVEIQAFRDQIADLLSLVEAELDFPEEEVGSRSKEEWLLKLKDLEEELSLWLEAYEKHRSSLESRRLLLIGPPNSGKSSLYNRILGQDRAIVFDEPGTTRDLLEVEFYWKGQKFLMMDSAGLRDAPEKIESLGIQKAKKALESADLVLWLHEEAVEPSEGLRKLASRAQWEFLWTKSDLRHSDESREPWIEVSSHTGKGLEDLESAIFGKESARDLKPRVYISSERQAEAIRFAKNSLVEASDLVRAEASLDWTAQKLRESIEKLEPLMGNLDHRDILHRVLARFCIGK